MWDGKVLAPSGSFAGFVGGRRRPMCLICLFEDPIITIHQVPLSNPPELRQKRLLPAGREGQLQHPFGAPTCHWSDWAGTEVPLWTRL
jgi:hypothetical protein